MNKILSCILCFVLIFSVCSIPLAYADDSDTDSDLTPLNEIVIDDELVPDITEIVTNQPYYFITLENSKYYLNVAYGAIRYVFLNNNDEVRVYFYNSTGNQSLIYVTRFVLDLSTSPSTWVRQKNGLTYYNLSSLNMIYSSFDFVYQDEVICPKNLADFDFSVNSVIDSISFDFDSTDTGTMIRKFIDTFSMLFRLLFVFFLMWVLYKFFNIFF